MTLLDMEKMKNLEIYQNHLEILQRVVDFVTQKAADPMIVAKVWKYFFLKYYDAKI